MDVENFHFPFKVSQNVGFLPLNFVFWKEKFMTAAENFLARRHRQLMASISCPYTSRLV